MSETRPRWLQAAGAAALAGTAVALAAVVTGGVVVLPVLGTLDPAAGLALPLVLLGGPAAAVGVAAGVVLGATAQGALSWWTALDAIVSGGVGYLGYRLWGTLPVVSAGGAPSLRSPDQWVELLAVTLVAGATAAAALAWGAVLGWGSPFHATALSELVIFVVSALVAAPVILLGGAPLVAGRMPAYSQRTRIEVQDGAFWGGVVTPLAWLLGGAALGLLTGVQSAQVVIGTIALALVVATYRPRRPQRTTPTDPQHSTDA